MAIIKKYKSIVSGISNPKPDIYIVEFKSLEKTFKYNPGQFLHLALDHYNPSTPWPESRCFSMQSNNNDDTIKITFSVKGKYTKRMANELKEGKEVWLKLPYGELFNQNYFKNNTVFIAGGTGITPYLSLFTSTLFREYINPVLYFGLRDESYNIYRYELDKAFVQNSTFKINYVYQNKAGLLDINKIMLENGNDKTYFISGPPVMIKGFKIFLFENNVKSDFVITDDWE